MTTTIPMETTKRLPAAVAAVAALLVAATIVIVLALAASSSGTDRSGQTERQSLPERSTYVACKVGQPC
jgi:hypothetical protein